MNGNHSLFEGERFAPLRACLIYALLPYGPLDRFVRSLLGEDGPGGGDPGWWIVWADCEDDAADPDAWKEFMQKKNVEGGCFEAWLDDDIAAPPPSCGYYSRGEVYCCVQRQLARVAADYPERSLEAALLSSRFAV